MIGKIASRLSTVGEERLICPVLRSYPKAT